eukprot:752594-Hanusia_phi.AAC.9
MAGDFLSLVDSSVFGNQKCIIARFETAALSHLHSQKKFLSLVKQLVNEVDVDGILSNADSLIHSEIENGKWHPIDDDETTSGISGMR